MGEYKGINVQYPTPSVTDEDIEMAVSDLIDENIEYVEITDRGAQNGDFVNLDFKGTVDGEEFDGGSAEGYELTLGAGDFLEEFEANVIGKKTGDSFTFKIVFPEDYDEELAGQEAEFDVTLNSVSEVITPEYNEEFVQTYTEYDTIEAYEASLKEELIASAKEESSDIAGEDALYQVIESSTIDGYPKGLYDSALEEKKVEYQAYAEMFGMEYDDFMTQFMGDETIDSLTLEYVNEILVCQAIAEEEGFAITDKNYKEEAEAMAKEYEYETVEDLEADYTKIGVIANILRDKTIDFLYENATIEEVSQEDYYGEDEDAEELEGETEVLEGETEA